MCDGVLTSSPHENAFQRASSRTGARSARCLLCTLSEHPLAKAGGAHFRQCALESASSERRGLQSSMNIGSCGFSSVETHRFVFLFIANDAEHIVERSNALSGKDRFPLDLIDSAFLSPACLRMTFGAPRFS